MAQPVFVVLEGLDGSGKSTLAQSLAQALHASLLATPLKELENVRTQVDASFGERGLARSLWYLAHVAAASERARLELAQGRSVVLDRYLLTTLAYAEAQGHPLELEGLRSQFLQPHVTLFCGCPRDIRLQRMADRAGLQPHDLEFLAPEREERLLSAYIRLGKAHHPKGFIPLEVGQCTRDGAVLLALEAIKSCHGHGS